MPKYQFVHLSRVERVSVGLPVEGQGVVDVIFKNGIYTTDDEAIAAALQKHPSFFSPSPTERIALQAGAIEPRKVEPKKEEPKKEEPIPVPPPDDEETTDTPAPEPAEEPAPIQEPELPVDYWSMTKKKLLCMAKGLGIHVHSDDNKDQIIAAIKEHGETQG